MPNGSQFNSNWSGFREDFNEDLEVAFNSQGVHSSEERSVLPPNALLPENTFKDTDINKAGEDASEPYRLPSLMDQIKSDFKRETPAYGSFHAIQDYSFVLASPTQSQNEESTASIGMYKTPNYKKTKSTGRYETKHASKDITQHEDKMKQKYGTKLSVRKDVVNKTLFRALKRYYTELFLNNYELDTKESSESYLKKIKEFSCRLFYNKVEELCFKGLTIDKVEKFLSIVISPNHVKPTLKEVEDLTLHKEFYSCIYQYSHKKLAGMLSNPVCGYLFTDFVNSGNLTKFIFTCSTMSQNSEVYDKAGKSFLEIIKGKTQKPCKGFVAVKASTQAI